MTNGCTSLTQALEEVVPLNGVKEEADPSVVVDGIVNGLVFFIVEGEKKFAMLDVRMTERRSVSTPQNEKVVHGPHQGFVEDIRANVNLVRNIARTPDLCTKFIPIGGANGLRGALLYREGMVDPKLLAKVKQKLLEAQRQKGFVLGEYSVARIFERRKYSLFPQALQTERPDRTAAFVMQGHIALICDGAPYALVVPITFFGLMHTSEDHYLRPAVATTERLVRILAMMITVLMPGLYIALVTFHQEVLPTAFMISTLTLRKMVGLPVVAEIVLTTLLFELVREASIRVQGGINQQLGIVGGIVLGEALVMSKPCGAHRHRADGAEQLCHSRLRLADGAVYPALRIFGAGRCGRAHRHCSGLGGLDGLPVYAGFLRRTLLCRLCTGHQARDRPDF